MKGGKIVRFIKTFDRYPHKFNFGHFYSSPVKLIENLDLKFRLKINHGFTNHGCKDCALLKPLYNFKEREHSRQEIFLPKCSKCDFLRST